jgi:hypothetical protein
MKILLLASQSFNAAEVVAQALQLRFDIQEMGSPFFVLRSSLQNENELVPPNYLPFVLEAEFKKASSDHHLFNKDFHRESLGPNYKGAAKNLVGVVPVSILAAKDLRRRLEGHGFDVVTAFADYKSKSESTVFLSQEADGSITPDVDSYDVSASDISLASLTKKIGALTCDAHNIGLDQEQITRKKLSQERQQYFSNPLSQTLRMCQLTSLGATTSNAGHTPLTLKTQFVDEYLCELHKTGVNSYPDLPHGSKLFVLDKAYLQKLVNPHDMRKVLQNPSLDVDTVVPAFDRLLKFADRINLNIAKLETATSLAEMYLITHRIDELLSDDIFMVDGERYKMLPKTVQVVIDEKASELLYSKGMVKSNDNTNSVPYNPNFPASHALSEFISAHRDPSHTNIPEQQPGPYMRMQ